MNAIIPPSISENILTTPNKDKHPDSVKIKLAYMKNFGIDESTMGGEFGNSPWNGILTVPNSKGE
jgi:hypothetical protein